MLILGIKIVLFQGVQISNDDQQKCSTLYYVILNVRCKIGLFNAKID